MSFTERGVPASPLERLMAGHEKRWIGRPLVALAAAVAAMGLCAAPADAGLDVTPPSVNLQPGLLYKVGTVLSDSSAHPTIPGTVTWTAYDDVGVTAQSGDFYGADEYVPSLKASTRRFRLPAVPLQAGTNTYAGASVSASDAAGNQGSGYHDFYSTLYEEGAMTASSGWSTATCDCWSAGAVFRSTRAGASLQYQFYGAEVAVIGDKAPGRGELRVYVDGRLQTTVDTAGTATNRVVVFQRRFDAYGTHTIKLVAASSARTDVDALITQTGD